jgi:hypothetical protein
MTIKKYICCILAALQHCTSFWGLFEDFLHKRKQLKVMQQNSERSITEVVKIVLCDNCMDERSLGDKNCGILSRFTVHGMETKCMLLCLFLLLSSSSLSSWGYFVVHSGSRLCRQNRIIDDLERMWKEAVMA